MELSQSLCDNFLVPLPVVCLLGGEEGQVEVPEVMEDGPTAAAPACQRDPCSPHGCQVALSPGVLMAPDDHGWVVSPQQQDATVLQVHVGIDPFFQSEVLVHISRLGM